VSVARRKEQEEEKEKRRKRNRMKRERYMTHFELRGKLRCCDGNR
jgi:hypothetical protein